MTSPSNRLATVCDSGLIFLSGDIDFYVSTTGSDSNDGLSSATPFLTIQKAVDTIRTKYLLCGYLVTINIEDGLYVENVNVANIAGGGIRFSGSTSVIWRGATTAWLLSVGKCSSVRISGITFGGGSPVSDGLLAADGARLTLDGGSVFAAMASFHLVAARSGVLVLGGNYSITGGAGSHIGSFDSSSVVYGGTINVTLTGVPAFNSFVDCGRASAINAGDAPSISFTGAATGKRYGVYSCAAIWTNGKGTSLFPGNAAGTVTAGGSYT